MVLLWLQRRDWEQPGSYHLWQALSFWGKYSPHWDSERQRKPSHRVSAYPGAGLGSSSAIGLLTPAGSLGARPLSGFSSILATQNGPLAERVSPRQGSKLTPEKCSKSKALLFTSNKAWSVRSGPCFAYLDAASTSKPAVSPCRASSSPMLALSGLSSTCWGRYGI